MISMESNVSLKPFNTFGIDCRAKYFFEVKSVAALQELISTGVLKKEKYLILGAGSNLLLTNDFDGLVILNSIKGYAIENQKEEKISLRVNSGERWHDIVMYSTNHHWGGIENLALIPGSVGAAPIQNIGAYGVEAKDVIEKVEFIDLQSGNLNTLTNGECHFNYRDSIFKHELKKNIFISSVTLTLTLKNHRFNTSYGAIINTLQQMNASTENILHIRDAVIKIRSEKLPDHRTLGNAGSFFKNPEISESQFHQLKKTYPEMPSYPAANQLVKLSAGWLIEQCGWKGKTLGQAGVHAHQALVLVNMGGASGEEILLLSKKISDDVQKKFSITLTPEVNIF